MNQNNHETFLMEQSCLSLLKLLVKKQVSDDMKAAAKNVFNQKYGKDYFDVYVCPSSFSLDLKYLEYFGDAFTKLRLNFHSNYITTLIDGMKNASIDATELVLCEQSEKNGSRHENDTNMIRDFLKKSKEQFPNLQSLTIGYLFCCADCPYFDGLIQLFAHLTDISIYGRVSFTGFLDFIGQNPQLEKVLLNYNNENSVCSYAEEFSWKLPVDFVQRLDSALPKLKCLKMLLPCVMEKPQRNNERYFKHLQSLLCGLHGPNSWMPNLLAISGNELEKLTLQVDMEDIVDVVFKKSAHLNRLNELTINAFFNPNVVDDDYQALSDVPADEIRSFILSHRQLNKITIQIDAFINGDFFHRQIDNVEETEKVEREKLQRIYRKVIEDTLDGHQWTVAGHLNEVKFSKNDA